MSELAEEVVAEWLNRQGFFTIRGRREGNTELDVLALRLAAGRPECWHYEVQVSLKPVGYISKYSLADQKRLGVPVNSARKRTSDELEKLVGEWVNKKFRSATVEGVRQGLCPSKWGEALVHEKVKDEEELRMIAKQGVTLVRFSSILEELRKAGNAKRQGAAGSNLAELLAFLPALNGA